MIFSPMCLFSQQEIEVSENYTTVLIFPSQVEEPILGNEQEYVIKPSNNNSSISKKTIRLGYVKIDNVEKNTNLTVITRNNNIYEFLLNYKKVPNKLTHFIKRDSSSTTLENTLEVEEPKNTTAKIPDSYYSKGVVTKKGKPREDDKNSEIPLDELYQLDDKTAYFNIQSKKVNNKKKRIFQVSHEMSNIELTLKQVSYAKDEIFFHLLLENKGGQTFDVDFIKSKLSRDIKEVGTDQSIPITPLYIYDEPVRVKGNTKANFIMIFKKFSINKKKRLDIDLAERNGERDLLLHIKSKYINNPVKLKK